MAAYQSNLSKLRKRTQSATSRYIGTRKRAMKSVTVAIENRIGKISDLSRDLMTRRKQRSEDLEQLYNDYYQRSAGVLNDKTLDLLAKHSSIDAPTLTSIHAGFEHARRSDADREMEELERYEKQLKERSEYEKEHRDIAIANEKARMQLDSDLYKDQGEVDKVQYGAENDMAKAEFTTAENQRVSDQNRGYAVEDRDMGYREAEQSQARQFGHQERQQDQRLANSNWQMQQNHNNSNWQMQQNHNNSNWQLGQTHYNSNWQLGQTHYNSNWRQQQEFNQQNSSAYQDERWRRRAAENQHDNEIELTKLRNLYKEGSEQYQAVQGALDIMRANNAALYGSQQEIQGGATTSVDGDGGGLQPTENARSINPVIYKGALFNTIINGESGHAKDPYKVWNHGVPCNLEDCPPMDFSKMTRGELRRRGNLPIGTKGRIHGFGKFQAITSTREEGFTAMGVPDDALITNELQNKLGFYILTEKQKSVKNFILNGKGNTRDITFKLSKEFASIENPHTGLSYYAENGKDKASISAEDVEKGLLTSRHLYLELRKNGLPQNEALQLSVLGYKTDDILPSHRKK